MRTIRDALGIALLRLGLAILSNDGIDRLIELANASALTDPPPRK